MNEDKWINTRGLHQDLARAIRDYKTRELVLTVVYAQEACNMLDRDEGKAPILKEYETLMHEYYSDGKIVGVHAPPNIAYKLVHGGVASRDPSTLHGLRDRCNGNRLNLMQDNRPGRGNLCIAVSHESERWHIAFNPLPRENVFHKRPVVFQLSEVCAVDRSAGAVVAAGLLAIRVV